MFSDEYADNAHVFPTFSQGRTVLWNGIGRTHFVKAGKNPKCFWKAFRWILEKVFKKTIMEGIFISADFGANPAYTLYSKSINGKIYIHEMKQN